MKAIFSLLIILALVFNISASPLIFKIQKEIKFGEFVELGMFDASKYKQIRIAVISSNVAYSNNIELYAIEGEDSFMFDSFDSRTVYMKVFDSPPQKIKVLAKGQGIYRLYVWASQ